MEARARPGLPVGRLAALAIPCLAGLAYLTLFTAPFSFVIVNAGAMVLGLAWIAYGRLPSSVTGRRTLVVALLMLLALPLATGPSLDGVTRWLSLGGVSLHAGMLSIPLLVMLTADDREIGPYALLAATLIAFFQPDAASTLALALAALALWRSQRDGKMAIVGVLALFASIGASFAAGPDPQPFVEGIFGEMSATSTVMSVTLAIALAVGIALAAVARWALAMTLVGYVLAAMLGDYPYPLIGYGAAAILGLALALADRHTAG